VAELIGSRLPNSLLLAAVTALFSVPIALTLGVSAAVWRGSWFDRAASTGAVAVVSVPEFLVATLAGAGVRRSSCDGCRACRTSPTSKSLGQLLRASRCRC
jgi:peptide/nickel transport system permease protein